MVWWDPLGLFAKKSAPEPEVRPEQRRAYAGATINRLTADWLAMGTSADAEINASLKILRDRSRQLCRDNDYARGAVRTIVNNVVGKGIVLQSQVRMQRGDRMDEGINEQIESLWLEWCAGKHCHTAGKLDFSDLERLVMRSVIESGEVLIRLVRQPFANSPVPLALEIIEADQLVDDYSGRDIRMGVQVDQWGRPVQYWLYPHHPGDIQFSRTQVGNRLLTLPASEILHPFLCDRPSQTRGVPWFFSTLQRLRHMGGYEEAELVAARAQAAVMGFVQTPDGELLADGIENNQRLRTLEPGAIEVLSPGETFAGFSPTRPGNTFDPFIRMMLRGAAAGLGLSYESLSRDFSNTSYSSARTSLLDERDNYRVMQQWLIRSLHQPIFEEWLKLAVLNGSLSLRGYEVAPRRFSQPRWVARGWQWVDPQNEVQAYKEAIKAGLMTASQVVAQGGQDIEDVLKERRRELDLADRLKIAFDTTVPDQKQEPSGLETLFPETPKQQGNVPEDLRSPINESANGRALSLAQTQWVDYIVEHAPNELFETAIRAPSLNPNQATAVLKAILETIYFDGIDEILDYAYDPDTEVLWGHFRDGQKRCDFELDPDNGELTYGLTDAKAA